MTDPIRIWRGARVEIPSGCYASDNLRNVGDDHRAALIRSQLARIRDLSVLSGLSGAVLHRMMAVQRDEDDADAIRGGDGCA